jgi:hypothetical protein
MICFPIEQTGWYRGATLLPCGMEGILFNLNMVQNLKPGFFVSYINQVQKGLSIVNLEGEKK